MKKIYSLLFFSILLSCSLRAEIYKITLTGIQACGGVTLVPLPLFTGGYTSVTLYYEQLVAADTWQLEATQVFAPQQSYEIYNGDDLLRQTTFRVRAIDNITGNEYISNSISVGPATWNVDRGTSPVICTSNWGNALDNSQNYIGVSINYTTYGRPPYRVEYKESTSDTWLLAGVVTGYVSCMGIKPFVYYNVRVTDYCGKVVNSSSYLDMQTQYTIDKDATTCSNGQVTITTNSDSRYSGIAPLQYAIVKYQSGQSLAQPVFQTNNVFTSLSPGVYYYYVKDAAGNQSPSSHYFTLGAGAQNISVQATEATDECKRRLSIYATGTRPFRYGFRQQNDADWTWTNDSTLLTDRDQTWYFRAATACGDTMSTSLFVSIPYPNARAEEIQTGTCMKSIEVIGAGSYPPYTYAIRPQGSTKPFEYQQSPAFNNLPPSIYELSVKDRCGKVNWVAASIDVSGVSCTLRSDVGKYESADHGGCTEEMQSEAWFDIHDDVGNTVFSINPNNNYLSSVCWGVNIVSNASSEARKDTIGGAVMTFLNRNFYIEPQDGSELYDSVGVRLYVTDEEMNNLLAAAAVTSPDSIKILKKANSDGSPVDLEVTNDASAESSLLTVICPTVQRYGNDWYLEFKVASFSEFNTFFGSGPSAPLPVKWLSFDAASVGTGVALHWVTAEEINATAYQVEWSTDGMRYIPVGTLAAKNTASSYAFTHESPKSGLNYYRIKQIDLDGRSTYSKVITVRTTAETAVLSIFPNPATDKLTVQVPAAASKRIARIFDANGRPVGQKQFSGTVNLLEIDIHALSAGWYLLQIDGDTRQKATFIKR